LVTFGNFGINDVVGLDGSVFENFYTLIKGTASINFSNVANLGVGNGSNIGGGKYAYFLADSPNLVVRVIPEPSTYALLALAVAGWGAHVWRRRKQVS
jgi:PEP-CTERM motif